MNGNAEVAILNTLAVEISHAYSVDKSFRLVNSITTLFLYLDANNDKEHFAFISCVRDFQKLILKTQSISPENLTDHLRQIGSQATKILELAQNLIKQEQNKL